MPAGRPKKPSDQKKLQGTWRKDRANPLEPTPAKGLPDRPAWVDGDPTTAALFDAATKYVNNMGIATEVDGIALGLLADQLGLYIQLRESIREEGVVIEIEGSTGQTKKMANPALPQLNQTLGSIHKLLREYGLTAASRSNVSKIEDDVKDDFESFLS